MATILITLLALSLGAGLISWLATGALLPVLRARAILDLPNQRSSHVVPTPRGGGIGLLAGLLLGWLGVVWFLPGARSAGFWPLLAAALVLAVVSFRDDVKSLPAWLRFGVQIAAIAAATLLDPDPRPVFQGLLPTWADQALAGLAWLWFVNLFNFMDGIDGISGIEAASIGAGAALVAWTDGDLDLVGYGLVLAAAAAGFLRWNWHPAKLFMGDVGSVPLGFLAGWLLLELARDGLWAAALILPAYYLADASWTLARRAWRREAIWRPHRSHFYQRAARGAASHAAVSGDILKLNIWLVLLAWYGAGAFAWLTLAVAAVIVAITLRRFGKVSPA